MKRFGVVVIVLAGVWVLTQSLLLLNYPLTFLRWGGDSRYHISLGFFLLLIPAVGALVLGAVLIVKRRRLAERWFRDAAPEVFLNGVSLLRAGVALIGIALIAQAIPSLVGTLTRPFIYHALDSQFGSTLDQFLESLPALIVGTSRLVIGLLLVARSRSLSKRLWLGRPAKEKAESPELPKCPSCGAQYDPVDYQGGLFKPKCWECGEPLNPDGT